MELTREEAVSRHRKMWRWIAEETEKQKRVVLESDYFKAMGIEEEDIPDSNFPDSNSYCCEYANKDCKLCPIRWDRVKDNCTDRNSPFLTWLGAVGYDLWKVAAKAARKIAELSERKENKEYE